MIHDLSATNSIINNFTAELRDISIQQDRWRFRNNLKRIASIAAYEISKTLSYKSAAIKTPLAETNVNLLEEVPVVGTIFRAGLAMHDGVLEIFDRADNAFISAYRKHKPDCSFDIELEYVSCPSLSGRVLILTDPMLATGASIVKTIQALLVHGKPRKIHLVCAIAAKPGIEKIRRELPEVEIWTGAIDPNLDENSYIVPGLGDAGDLAYGEKAQK